MSFTSCSFQVCSESVLSEGDPNRTETNIVDTESFEVTTFASSSLSLTSQYSVERGTLIIFGGLDVQFERPGSLEYSIDEIENRLHGAVVKVCFSSRSLIRVGSLTNLRVCQGLVHVDISGAQIWSDGPEILAIAGNCPLLKILDLSFIMETCTGYPLIILAQRLRHLVTLKLSSWFDHCDDALVHLISESSTLRSLFISHCSKLSDLSLFSFRQNGGDFYSDSRCGLCNPPIFICDRCRSYA